MKRKSEIIPSPYKFTTLNVADLNCQSLQYHAMQGSFNFLCSVEGCFIRGVELGYWGNYAQMFKITKLMGLRYRVESYCRFRRGALYSYLPAIFVSVLCSLVGLNFGSSYALGLERANMYVLRNRERWASFGVYPSE